MKTTRVFNDNLEAYQRGKRRALNEGGTYSSKTWSIIRLLIHIAENAKSTLLISIVSESLPHLRKGAIRDFFTILDSDPKSDPNYNMSEHVYRFNHGHGIIEFFGADESGKVRGPRRDILFINEGNNVPWEVARGLDIRTRSFTFVDWNPVSEFWVHEYESGGKPIPGWIHNADSAYIHSTYLDAIDILPAEVVANIESNRRDPNWWNIYGLGRIGKVEGLVYPYFEQVNQLPPGNIFYGLDFGYSNDPTVLTKHIINGDMLFSQELIFETGLTNQAIAERMIEVNVTKRYDEIYADSAEPKSIDEIHAYGFNIYPVTKGPGSVAYGQQRVQQYKQYWTKDSTNCIKEQRNFRYIADKNGKLTDKTTHQWSHGMDARRYAVMGNSEIKPHDDIIIYDAMQDVGKIDL